MTSVIAPSSSQARPASAQRPISILKQQKRGSADLDADLIPSSPKKRHRVAFDTADEVFDPRDQKSSILIQEEVRFALRKHTEGGDEQPYYDIKKLFSQDPRNPSEAQYAPSSSLLRKHLIGLTNNATALNRSCADLVNEVINTQWVGRDEAFVARFVSFLGILLSSQGGYLGKVLKMLVSHFAEMKSSTGKLPNQERLSRAEVQDRIHSTLKYLLQLIPLASGALSKILADSFPYLTDTRRRAKRSFVEYVRNVLKVTEYAPELKSEILDLVVERHVKIDVQAQIDVDELEEDIEEMLLQDGPSTAGDPLNPTNADEAASDDDDSDDESDISDSDLDDDIDDDEEREKCLKLSISKLDSGLDTLFTYYAPIFTKPDSLSSQQTFNQLLSQFRKIVLPTYRSRHTQFLLFHFAQTSPDLTTAFTDALAVVLADKSRSPIIRISAAAYIASFIARGARIQPDSVLYAFDTLAAYVSSQRAALEPSCRGPDLRRFSTYYAAVQALLYIFCFRWRALLHDADDEPDPDETDDELLSSGRALVFAPGVRDALSSAVFGSRLNPLKVCAPEIVEEFARVAHALGFLYVWTVVESNKRVRLGKGVSREVGTRETSLTGIVGERQFQLDAYFPFDPYRLPVSRRWVEGEYVEWKGVPGQWQAAAGVREEDSSLEEEEEKGSEEEMEEVGTETPDRDD